MRQMKDSGVEWIDEIPTEWKIVPFKTFFDFYKGLPITKADLTDKGISVISYGQIHSKYNTGVHISENLIRYVSDEYLSSFSTSLSRRGDILFADTSEDMEGIGNCVLNDYDNTLFAGYHTIGTRPITNTHSRFLAYLFQTDNWRSQLRIQASGIKVFSVTQRMLKTISIILPTEEASEHIVDYLDEKCAKIDTIIAKQQEVIEKLKEYKLSVITEAVTKGLNPDVPMKDSEIEWIGMIPAHWEIHKFCWDYSAMLGKMLDAKRVTGQNLHPYIKNVDVQWGTINTEALEQMDFEEDEYERYSVKPGDLMICEGGEIGKCTIVPEDFPENIYYQKALHRVRKQSINSGNINFLYYLMFCMAKNDCLNTSPEKATIAHLPGDALSQLRMPAPPVTEQQEISEYLNVHIEKIESMIFRKLQVINKLMEYKKSLIYEVVTGKREV